MFKNTVITISISIFFATASTVASLYLVKENFIRDFKSISLVEILKDENDSVYKKFIDKEINEEEYTKLQEKKMALIQERINMLTNEKTILIMNEMLVKSNSNNMNIENITEDVKKYVEQNLYDTKK